MSCNCTNIYDIGCKNACEQHSIGFQAVDTGVHTLKVKVLGETFTYYESLQATQNIYVDLTLFNEDADILIEVYDPNNEKMTFEVDNVEYDCIKLRSQIVIETNLIPN